MAQLNFAFSPRKKDLTGRKLAGNEMMIRDGVLEGPKVERTLSMHVWNEKPVGWIGVGEGTGDGRSRIIHSQTNRQRRTWRSTPFDN